MDLVSNWEEKNLAHPAHPPLRAYFFFFYSYLTFILNHREVIHWYGVRYHYYANETHLYITIGQ